MEEVEKHDENLKNDRDDVYSKSVRAGKRTYFFDVKATRRDEYYLTITESKKRTNIDGTFFYEKHKIFLYKEDFEKFAEGLNDVVSYINNNNLLPNEISNTDSTEQSKPLTSDVKFEDLAGKKE